MLQRTFKIIVLGLAIASPSWIAAQETFQKTFQKAYGVEQDVTVDITNKYGKVKVKTWEKDSVKITVNYTATAKTAEKLAKLKESITVDFTGTRNFVTAKTSILVSNSFSSDLKRIVELVSPGNELVLDYKVYLPKNAELKIDNKYGDIYLDDRNGETAITLAHGDLKATNFSEKLRINASFGDIRMDEAKDIVAEFSYCDDVIIEKAEDIELESKNTRIEIEEIRSMKIDSKRDKIRIERIQAISGESSQSDITLKEIGEEIRMTSKFGDITIDRISREFDRLDIDSKYCDITLNFETGSIYNFDLQHRNVDFDFPISISQLNTVFIGGQDKKLQSTTGQIGKGSAIKKVKLTAESSDVIINHD